MNGIDINRRNPIRNKFFVGFFLILILNGCSTLRESLILGAGTGLVVGGISGHQRSGDRGENVITGAVLGSAIGGLASYMLYESLEKRDANVRRETLMNLEHYNVLGFGGSNVNSSESQNGNCFTTHEVDGHLMSIPCGFAGGLDEIR